MNNSETKEELKTYDEFSNVITNLIRNIKEPFPEVVDCINKRWQEVTNSEYIDNSFDISNNEDTNGSIYGPIVKLIIETVNECPDNLNVNMKDALYNLFKNPTKFMEFVKKVGDKLDLRINSGEITESEINSETTKNIKALSKIALSNYN